MEIGSKALRIFVTVTQEKTITAAAECLFLSKPAVSMALSSLEKQLGVHLFDRHQNRLILNQQGKQLLPVAYEFLERSVEIKSLFSKQLDIGSQLRLGASDTIGNQIVPHLLHDFQSSIIEPLPSVVISNTSSICQKLIDLELDIGLLEGSISERQIHKIAWGSDKMVVICSIDHPLAQQKEVNLEQLNDHAWLLRENGSSTREFFLHQLAPYLSLWHCRIELNSTEAIINSVSAGLGLSFLSYFAVQKKAAANQLKILTLSQEAQKRVVSERQYWIGFHQDKYQSPVFKRFISHCQKWSLMIKNLDLDRVGR